MFTEIFTYARSVLLAMGVSSPSIFLFFFYRLQNLATVFATFFKNQTKEFILTP